MKTALGLSLDPNAIPGPNIRWVQRTMFDRFWSHVDKSGSCWLWTGYINYRGYGVFGTTGGNTRAAHRVSWALTNGEIPRGTVVRHGLKCISRACVRPSHLRLGTQKDNMADAILMGRLHRRTTPVGTDRWNAILNPALVAIIRREWAGGLSPGKIAARRGLTNVVVRKVVTLKTWRHVG